MIESLGVGSIQNLQRILKSINSKRVFFITGNSSLEKPNIKKVKSIIRKECEIYHFDEISSIPSIEGVKIALNSFRKSNSDVIVAMGGGSVLDIGKSVSIFSTNKGNIEDYLFKKISFRKKGIPLILIPSTAGTGSEATHFAVIFKEKTKYSLADEKFMRADYIIVDPELTYSLPKRITAYTGMDAFCQGIESFWNINSTDESKEYAKKAIRLIMNNIEKAVNSPDEESRYNMAIGANYAGKAINITKTTAAHAISYPITSYFNVPHGLAVALTISSMIFFNAGVNKNDVLDPRGLEYVKKIMDEVKLLIGARTFIEAQEIVNNLIKKIGLELKLSELGISSQSDLEIIVKNGFNPERVKNNPRLLTEPQLREILEGIK
ncbi:MAG: phosphonoacetaldehyde reductase [Promethearchaeota archaeon]